MDIPLKVYVTCPMAELKQVPGMLISVSPHGFYEINVNYGSNTHLILRADRGDHADRAGARPQPGVELRGRALERLYGTGEIGPPGEGDARLSRLRCLCAPRAAPLRSLGHLSAAARPVPVRESARKPVRERPARGVRIRRGDFFERDRRRGGSRRRRTGSLLSRKCGICRSEPAPRGGARASRHRHLPGGVSRLFGSSRAGRPRPGCTRTPRPRSERLAKGLICPVSSSWAGRSARASPSRSRPAGRRAS